MLDLDLLAEPVAAATDVVSRVEMKRHLNIHATVTAHDDTIDECIADAVDKLEGIRGELRRTIRPATWTRYMSKFPDLVENGVITGTREGPILLPLPPLIEVYSVNVEDGESPTTFVDPADYVIKTGTLVPEIWPVTTWPSVTEAPRAVSVTYRAGYTTYPPVLKRFVRMYAAHYFENRELTINEPRQMMINRRVEFGADHLLKALQIPLDQNDWGE